MSSVSYLVGHLQPTWNHNVKYKNLPISMSLNYTNINCLMFISPEGCLKKYCFSQANFQSSATHKFVMDWALNHFDFDRPGLHIHKQCPNCQSLKTRVQTINPDGSISLQCSGCTKEVTYNLSHGWKWLHNVCNKQD